MSNIELRQRRRFGAEQHFVLDEDDYLLVSVSHPGSERCHRIELVELDAHPARLREWPVGWLLAGGVAAVFALAALAAMLRGDEQGSVQVAALLAIAGLALAFVCGRMYFKQRMNLLAFCNRFTGQVRVPLWFGNPDHATFLAFAETLAERIRALHANDEMTGEDSIASELRELKHLLDEGALTPEEFEATKRRLLGMSGLQRPGLH